MPLHVLLQIGAPLEALAAPGAHKVFSFIAIAVTIQFLNQILRNFQTLIKEV